MPAGRPTSYQPEFCERVVELGKQGCGKAEIAFELGVVRDTLDEWAKVHPEFSDAVRHARESSAGWWEQQGRKGITNREFNANAYSLQVRNRFPDDWRDKTENKTTLAADSSIAGLLQRVAENGKRVFDTDS